MPHGQTPLTSASLVGRLRPAPADQAAWAEFVGRYGPLVYDWCRQWRLQDADAKDVTQGVLLHLVRRLQAKSKVVRMLREEVRKLGGDEPAAPA